MKISKREKEVLILRKEGFAQKEIASKLKISQPAVSLFESNAKRKISQARKILKFATENEIRLEDEE